MPTRRRTPKAKPYKITEAAVAAFSAGDMLRLHRELGLRPWMPSPLPLSVSGLGVDTAGPGPWREADWRLAVELQRELLAAGAKMPPR